MKSLFAQAATLALSVAGALAIVVGIIDQPHIIASDMGSAPSTHVVVAATTPAVSPLA